MNNWRTVKVGDIALRITSGGTPSTSRKDFYGGSIPWLKTQEVNFERIFKTETTITEDGLRNSSAKWIEADSVIVAMYGNTAAKVAITKIPLTTNQACCNITVNKAVADYRYLYYYFFKEYTNLKGLANGGAQQNLNANIIRNYEIHIPNLSTQRRIAEILSALDDKIELNRRMNQTLEQMAQTLFRQYFVDGIDEENLPEGWRVGKLGEVTLRITKGTTPTTLKRQFVEAGINFIKVESITETGTIDLNKLNFIDEETDQLLSRSRIQDQDILFSIAGTLGRMAVVSPEILPANTNQAVAIIRPDSTQIEPLYIYYWLKLEKVREEAFSRKVHAVQANLSLGVLSDIEIIVPPLSIQNDKFVEINNFFKKIKCNGVEIQKLTQLRDTLLPKLMSGEIDVMQTKPSALYEPVLS